MRSRIRTVAAFAPRSIAEIMLLLTRDCLANWSSDISRRALGPQPVTQVGQAQLSLGTGFSRPFFAQSWTHDTIVENLSYRIQPKSTTA